MVVAQAKGAATVYRSIYLSLFGKQFCDVCFTLDGYDAGGTGQGRSDQGRSGYGNGYPASGDRRR